MGELLRRASDLVQAFLNLALRSVAGQAGRQVKGEIARSDGVTAMKMIAEYLEHALHFEQMAAETADEKLKEALLAQARDYHKMAAERARRLQLQARAPKR